MKAIFWGHFFLFQSFFPVLQRLNNTLLNKNHLKSLYIRRFRPGQRFTEKLDPNLTHSGRIQAEQPESMGKTRYINY